MVLWRRLEKELEGGFELGTKVRDESLTKKRRRQIVEGAIRVFSKKGFHPATVDEIAKEAKVTIGTLYNYIRSKPDLIYLAYQYVSEILVTNLLDGLRKNCSAADRLNSAISQNLRDVWEYQDIIMFLYKESGSMDRESLHAVLARETKYIEMFEELVKDYLQELGYKANEERARLLGDILSYLPVMMIFRRWSLKRRFGSMEKVMEELTEFAKYAAGFAKMEKEAVDGD